MLTWENTIGYEEIKTKRELHVRIHKKTKTKKQKRKKKMYRSPALCASSQEVSYTKPNLRQFSSGIILSPSGSKRVFRNNVVLRHHQSYGSLDVGFDVCSHALDAVRPAIGLHQVYIR